jgi:hypothetical protein
LLRGCSRTTTNGSGFLYLIVVSTAFFLGGIFAALIRLELTTPGGDLLSADVYNRMFTMHGVTMVFFVLVPAGPGGAGQLCDAPDDWREGRRVSQVESAELVRLHDRASSSPWSR